MNSCIALTLLCMLNLVTNSHQFEIRFTSTMKNGKNDSISILDQEFIGNFYLNSKEIIKYNEGLKRMLLKYLISRFRHRRQKVIGLTISIIDKKLISDFYSNAKKIIKSNKSLKLLFVKYLTKKLKQIGQRKTEETSKKKAKESGNRFMHWRMG